MTELYDRLEGITARRLLPANELIGAISWWPEDGYAGEAGKRLYRVSYESRPARA
jgi:hypothetical protein